MRILNEALTFRPDDMTEEDIFDYLEGLDGPYLLINMNTIPKVNLSLIGKINIDRSKKLIRITSAQGSFDFTINGNISAVKINKDNDGLTFIYRDGLAISVEET